MKKLDEETWREFVKRIASQYGMEQECLEDYDDCILHGESPQTSAYTALYEWDII